MKGIELYNDYVSGANRYKFKRIWGKDNCKGTRSTSIFDMKILSQQDICIMNEYDVKIVKISNLQNWIEKY